VTRVALVTGAGRGIGAATAGLLEEQGWQVVRIDKDWPAEAEPSEALTIDLGELEQTQTRLAAIPRVDALINNAGMHVSGPIAALSPDQLEESFRVNLFAAMIAVTAVLPRLTASQGSVVNVASVHAVATTSDVALYAAAKAGLVSFTRSAAIELASRAIRVNAVLPGAIDTSMLLAGSAPDRRDGAIADLALRTPLGRIGAAREVAEAVAFLADNERSSFVTGTSLTVDGGVLARLASE
jgi:NAD(P)-dependent dehydrogenase (short-subunit alcohol dehydrogenase family)